MFVIFNQLCINTLWVVYSIKLYLSSLHFASTQSTSPSFACCTNWHVICFLQCWLHNKMKRFCNSCLEYFLEHILVCSLALMERVQIFSTVFWLFSARVLCLIFFSGLVALFFFKYSCLFTAYVADFHEPFIWPSFQWWNTWLNAMILPRCHTREHPTAPSWPKYPFTKKDFPLYSFTTRGR